MKPEIHLFIIWPKALYKKDQIVKDIKHKFEVIDECEVIWSNKKFSNNLSRFYGVNLPDKSFKERHCGKGPFQLLIVHDKNPAYGNRKTTKGIKFINLNLFDSKKLYRKWTGGGHKIHATNTKEEMHHDLALLFGMDAEPYFLSNVSSLNKKYIKSDLAGANNWKSMQELFYVLNNTIKYVILRNYEQLPHRYTSKIHSDIDLLVSDYKEACYITNSKEVFGLKHRVQNCIKIGEKNIFFDFRYIGDNYYDESWEKNILARRKFNKKGFYVPSDEDYFFSLLYHALVHKPFISKDYREKLANIANDFCIGETTPELFIDTESAKCILERFLCKNKYFFTDPYDLSVYYNESVVGRKRVGANRKQAIMIKNFFSFLIKPLKLKFIKKFIKKFRIAHF